MSLRVDRRGETEQLRQLVDRDVGPNGLLECVDELGQARDQVLGVRLLTERQQDSLLALAAIEVRRAVARSGVLQRLVAVHVLDPARDIDPLELPLVARVVVVGDGDLDVDRDAADRIDDRSEPVEIDLDEVLDVEPVEVADDRLEAVVATGLVVPGKQVRSIADSLEPAVDLAREGRTEQALGGTRRHRHVDGVARQAEHRDLLGHRVDRDDDQRVGVVGALVRPLVGADQEDVQALLAVPRRDGDLGDVGADSRSLGGR